MVYTTVVAIASIWDKKIGEASYSQRVLLQGVERWRQVDGRASNLTT